MRTALLAIASLLLLTGTVDTASAQASNYGRAPFCSRAILGEGDAIRCNFYSMASCRFEVRGRGGYCIRNPALAAYGRYDGRRYRR